MCRPHAIALLLVACDAARVFHAHNASRIVHNVTLSIAFTTDLHGEIAPLKHAHALVEALPHPKLLVDAGDAFIGTEYFRKAGPAGMGRVMRARPSGRCLRDARRSHCHVREEGGASSPRLQKSAETTLVSPNEVYARPLVLPLPRARRGWRQQSDGRKNQPKRRSSRDDARRRDGLQRARGREPRPRARRRARELFQGSARAARVHESLPAIRGRPLLEGRARARRRRRPRRIHRRDRRGAPRDVVEEYGPVRRRRPSRRRGPRGGRLPSTPRGRRHRDRPLRLPVRRGFVPEGRRRARQARPDRRRGRRRPHAPDTVVQRPRLRRGARRRPGRRLRLASGHSRTRPRGPGPLDRSGSRGRAVAQRAPARQGQPRQRHAALRRRGAESARGAAGEAVADRPRPRGRRRLPRTRVRRREPRRGRHGAQRRVRFGRVPSAGRRAV
mmetsp:Transcript_16890/g.51212  ORF Transcript_16890/g.51212 Transcript_16890/m.51212 type:complete len:444 (-) Transcript_16890:881-2212(-)